MEALGRGDLVTALSKIRASAEQGDADAQVNIAFMYHAGQGVTQNYGQAFYWYKASAAQGNAKAQYNAGVLYYEGEGVVQDAVEAHKWFNISARNGFNRSAIQKDKIEKKMTAPEIELAQKMADEWIEGFSEYTLSGE